MFIHDLIIEIFQKTQNETYISMISQTLSTPFFYFSYTYDLTHSLQRLSSMNTEFYEVKCAFLKTKCYLNHKWELVYFFLVGYGTTRRSEIHLERIFIERFLNSSIQTILFAISSWMYVFRQSLCWVIYHILNAICRCLILFVQSFQ